MKKYESFFARDFKRYIKYRSSIGFKNSGLESELYHFDRYLIQNGYKKSSIYPLLFLEFQNSLKLDAKTVNKILSSLRGFFQFLIREEKYSENPLKNIPSRKELDFIPFVFSEKDVNNILNVIEKNICKIPRRFLRDLAIYTCISLIAACGLRINEPINLLLSNCSLKEKTIYIENTKFGKDRLIPVPEPLIPKMTNYLAVRQVLKRWDKSPYFFCDESKQKLSTEQIYTVFKRAIQKLNLYKPKKTIGNITFGAPRIHSFRHSFAINTLRKIKQQGKSPQKYLPVLAAYMGHGKYKDTAVYLKVLDAEQRKELIHYNAHIWDTSL